MKKLKIRILSLGILSAVIISSTPVFANTKSNSISLNPATKNVTLSDKQYKVSAVSGSYTHFSGGTTAHGKVTASYLNVRDNNFDVIASLRRGTYVSVDGFKGNWWHICSPYSGFVSKDYIEEDET